SSVSVALRQRVNEVQADLEMVQRLETTWLDPSAVGDGHYDLAGAREAYRQGVAADGGEKHKQSPGEAAARVPASAVPGQVVAALYSWTFWGGGGRKTGFREELAFRRAAHSRFRRMADATAGGGGGKGPGGAGAPGRAAAG